jgi:hypothetical protein
MEERSWIAESNFGKAVKASRGEDNANYYFNTRGYFTEKEIYAQSGALQVRYQYQYYNTGQLQQLTLFNRGGLQRHYLLYQYNSKKQLLSQTQFQPNGTPMFSYQYQYNETGKQAGYTWYNSEKQKEEDLKNEYDSKGNLVKATSHNGDGSLATLAMFAYDDSNNLIEEKIYSYGSDTLFRKTAYRYNSRGQQVAMLEFVKDSITALQTVYTYTEDGAVKTEQKFDASNNPQDLYSFVYIYDAQKNWIRKTSFRNGIPVLITERELEYYKNK